MVRTILVPLDGSAAAEEALPAAAWLADRFSARIALVRPVRARVGPGEDAEAMRRSRASQADVYLQDQAASIHDRYPRLHVVTSAPVGPWPNAVLDAVSLEAAELVVASTRLAGDGRSALAGLLGSAAVVLSRRAEVPVVLVPRRATFDDARPLRVLIPLDGSATAEAILPLVVRYGAVIPMRAIVLRVVPPCELSTTAAGYCGRVARWLTQHGVPSRIEIRAGTPSEQIGQAAFERADLLALGLPEALPWRIGYSAEVLLRLCRVPVLQLRSRRSDAVVPEDTPAAVSAGPVAAGVAS